MRLREPFRAGNYHRPDRVRAHDMAVVVDLDPPGRFFQTKYLGESFQMPRLRGGFRHPPRKRLARVVDRVLHQIALVAALRENDLDLALRLDPQGFGQQRLFRQGMA